MNITILYLLMNLLFGKIGKLSYLFPRKKINLYYFTFKLSIILSERIVQVVPASNNLVFTLYTNIYIYII